MNVLLHVTLLIAGLVILWKAADVLVSGAVALAERLGVSSLVVGLTVVAMGTSAPELAASIAGVLQKQNGGDLAVGNVFGSNITNLALVGGLVAVIRPLQVRKQTIAREIPAMIACALLLWPLMRNAAVSRQEAALMLIVFVVLLGLVICLARRRGPDVVRNIVEGEPHTRYRAATLTRSLLFVVIGLTGLALGAKMTVVGAVFIGREILGISPGVIALTLIAFGTSLPELVTCVVAAVRAQHDISVGNLVGSNIFNTLLVTGGAGVVRPFSVSPPFAGGSDYWIMVAVGVAFALLIIIGRRTLGRAAGILLLAVYTAYIVYLLALTATA